MQMMWEKQIKINSTTAMFLSSAMFQVYGWVEDLVHTNTFSFENASFLSILPFRPYWDGIYVKEALTRSFLKTLSKVDKFENAIFYIVVWTVKTEAFENDDACLVMWHILYQ